MGRGATDKASASGLLYGPRRQGPGPKDKSDNYQLPKITIGKTARLYLRELELEELTALGVEQLRAWREEGQIINLETLPDSGQKTVQEKAALHQFDFSGFVRFYNALFDQIGDNVLIEIDIREPTGRYWLSRQDKEAGKRPQALLDFTV